MKRTPRSWGLVALAAAAVLAPVGTSVANAAESTAGSTANAPAATFEGDTVPGRSGDVAPLFYNGENAAVSEFPGIVAGVRAGGTRPEGQTCSGTVVAPRKILIAAHCADAAGEKSFCAGYPDGRTTILPGDSGGPLIVDSTVVGVASWSRSDFTWYSVYGRLDNAMGDWVKQEVGTVTATPSSGSGWQGRLVQTSVRAVGGTGGIALTATGAPAGTQVTFNPAGVGQNGASAVWFFTNFQTPVGSYPITIRGTSADGKTGATTFTLTVTRFGFGAGALGTFAS